MTRKPAVAGRFYEADVDACATHAHQLCTATTTGRLPESPVGAIVPHAGWVCSGRIAGMTFAALASRALSPTVFLTGSVHTMMLASPALDEAEAWQTPLGQVAVDASLRRAVAELPGFATIDAAHAREHSLEVQLPLMQTVWPDGVKIVPCMIPPEDAAPQWGRALGALFASWPTPVLVVASVDLTHYGPNYGFTPQGAGPDGNRWAHDVNDRRLLERIESLDADSVVSESRRFRNTCGGGALAAVLAAARVMGASRGVVLEHTDSSRELAKIGHADTQNSVGYAGVVLG